MRRTWFFWRSKQVRLRGPRALERTRSINKARFSRPVGEQLEARHLLAAITDPSTASLSDLGLDTASYRPSSLLVQFRDGGIGAASVASSRAAGARVTGEWSIAPGLHRVDLDAGIDLAATLAAYRSDPNVLFAEPDFRVSLDAMPDDANFGNLWGLNNDGSGGGVIDADIDAPEAWDKTKGSHETIVAVIDTGVDYTHPDLAANIWTNPDEIAGDKIDNDGNGYVDDIHGYDFVNNDGDPMDDHFHGTHVAGTIGAVGNNGIGISGVNWNVQIMALKFLDASGGGYTSDAIAALNYAVANGAIASNNSWGGGGFSAAFQTAIQNARNKGHIFVAAAGNDGANTDSNAFYPAGYNVDNVISVGATDISDSLAYFSNFGVKSVDLTAPGVDIYSTFPTHMTQAMRDEGFSTNYETISGTSMATPHVTGVIALVASLHRGDPNWGYEDTIAQVFNTVDVIPGASKTVTGGRLNAAGAVGNAPPDTLGPRVAELDPAGGVNAPISQVRLRFNETIDPATISVSDVVSLAGPDGPIAVLAVLPVAGSSRQFDVTFAPQTKLGDYTIVFGPEIADAFGNAMDQDADGVGGENPDDIFTGTFSIVDVIDLPSDDVPKFIEWVEFTPSTLEVTQDVKISDLNVTLDVWFPFDGDLAIYLESPDGTQVDLSIFNGGFDSDFTGTVFDDEADVSIVDGFAPYTGPHRPDAQLSAFDGKSAKGTWTLWIYNIPLSGSLDGDGWINSWSLQIQGGAGSPPPPPPPPANRAPVANDDAFVGNDVNEDVVLSTAALLANDTDPDGNPLSVTFFSAPIGGSVTLEASGIIRFRPTPFFEGQAGFDYVVSDGTLTDVGHVSIDIEPEFQWHNLQNAYDVDDDGDVSPIDAVLVINLLNATGGTPLEGMLGSVGASPTTFYDVSPDNFVAPDDAVLIINYLNAHPNGSKSASGASSTSTGGSVASELPSAGALSLAEQPSATQALDRHSIDLLLAQLAADEKLRRRR